ncbi:MAG: DUF554 domain-containing protein [Treponemataceae bacterium]|jgi:uncharacterized membrane protein YqgA involved in biofilm formation|nr:DUF554 domain-containing protein [Treponemataceae bacterium]
MIAVFVNCFAIILGSFLGIMFSRKMNSELNITICDAAGVVTFVIGLQMALNYNNIIYVILSLIIGGILGNLADIDGKILQFGKFLEKHLYHKKIALQNSQIQLSETSSTELKTKKLSQKNFAYAFLNASVLFCVGAMAIIGSFKAGIQKDYTIIFTKSVLDGFMSIGFAASMGVGTAFSCIAIFLYQGSLTLLASFISPFVTDALLTELSATGGCMIMMIGLNLLEIKKIKTANYLPSMILVVIFVLLDPYIQNIASQILK